MRRKVLALGLAVIVVLALWTGGWFWGAAEIRNQIALLAAADGETEPRVECGTFDITGFPFRFDADCTDLSVVYGDHEVTLAALRASVLAYNPTHVIFSARAPYGMYNAFTGSRSRFDFGNNEGSARLVSRDLMGGLAGEGWRIARISVVLNELSWYDTVLEDLLQASATEAQVHLLDMAEQHDRAAGTSGLALFAELKNLAIPALQVAAANTSLQADLVGLPDDIRLLGAPDILQRWQQAGGHLRLVRFAGDQPEPADSFEVTGEAMLTPNGLVNARLDYTTRGIFERLGGMLPTTTLAMFRGLPQPDGSFRNELEMVDGRLNALAMTMLEVPPLW